MESAFLHAIAEKPDDRALWQVYADWLEDQGDPRSDFLRLEAQLRLTPFSDLGRQEVGQRWRHLRATLDQGWVRQIGGYNLVPPWATGPMPTRVGVRDYHVWMSGNHFEWVILAVLAPIDDVARTLIETRVGVHPQDFLPSNGWHRNVPIRSGAEGDRISPLIPLVQLHGHRWTIAVYDTFNLSMRTLYSAAQDAQELSLRLATLAITFGEEDTASTTAYQLFECGELMEFTERSPDLGRYASKKRPDHPGSVLPEYFPDAVFRDCGLYIPSCYARNADDGPCLVVEGLLTQEIEQADLLALWSSFRDEPPTSVPVEKEFSQVHILWDEHGIFGPPTSDPTDDLEGEVDIPF